MSQLTHLFALSVYRDKIILAPDYKQRLVQLILEMESGTPLAPRRAGTAWLGDTRGQEFLFRQPEFAQLYRQISAKVIDYLEALGINHQVLHLYYQRSWATITRRSEHISEHAHVQSNFTFAYYLRKPPGSGGIYFITNEHPNEFSPGAFSPAKESLGLIRHGGMLTWNRVQLDAEEDDILIFPSKTLHGTARSNSDEPRISLSADIMAMLRNSDGHETMMPHFSNWRSFDELDSSPTG